VRQIIDDDGVSVSASEFGALVALPHLSITAADLFLAGRRVEQHIPITSGRVTYDRKAAVRGRCSATFATEGVNANLSVAGYEVQLWRGIVMPGSAAYTTWTDYVTSGGEYVYHPTGGFVVVGDTSESFGTATADRNAWVSLGVFGIQDVEIDDHAGEAVSRIDGEDLSRKIADATLEDDVVWTTADTLETVVATMISEAVPYMTFLASGATHAAPPVTHERGANRWDVVLEAARGVGYEVYVDGYSVVWRPEPDLRTAAPFVEVHEGPQGRWGSGKVQQSRRPSYNSWTVTGHNSDSNVDYTATVIDDDPNSPTYYYGPFGKKPAPIERSEHVDSQAKADAAAAARRAKEWGISRVIPVETWPDPRVETGDAVSLRRSVLGVDEVALVDELDMGILATDWMTLTARTKQAST
jgi:hypothetical protein